MLAARYPCPACNSSDNLTLYGDGHWYCFTVGCEAKISKKHFSQVAPAKVESEAYLAAALEELDLKKGGTRTMSKPAKEYKFLKGVTQELEARGISEDTCRKYNYQCGTYKDNPCQIENYYDKDRQLIGQKLKFNRETAKTPYMTIGTVDDLFGKHLFKIGGRSIVITEGAIDCMSLAEVQGCKFPVVSIPNGADAAKKCLEKNHDWLTSNFETIVLMFDMDKAGRKAVESCAPLFTTSQLKIAELPAKDANEMLTTGRGKELLRAYFEAKPYKLDSILQPSEITIDLTKKREYGESYPWPTLTELSYGMRDSQFNMWLGGTGMGKTTMFKQIIADRVTSGDNVGIFLMEDQPEDSLLSLAGMVAGKRFDSPEFPFEMAEAEAAIKHIQKHDNLYIGDNFLSSDINAMFNSIRFMATACGCKYIFIDHLTTLIDGQSDELQFTKKLCKDIAGLREELKVHIECISHIRKNDNSKGAVEAGGDYTLDSIQGGAALKQYCNNIFGIKKKKDGELNEGFIEVMKARDAGHNVGKKVYFRFFPEKGLTIEQGEEGFDYDLTVVGEKA